MPYRKVPIKCFDDWIIRWHKCITSNGTHFEDDKINLDD